MDAIAVSRTAPTKERTITFTGQQFADLCALLTWVELYFLLNGQHQNDAVLDRINEAVGYREEAPR